VELVSAVLDLLFPPRCVFCHRILRRGTDSVCTDCRAHLPYTDGGEKHGDFFRVCHAPLYYEGTVRESLHRYKFGGVTAYAGAYGVLLADCIRENMEGQYDVLSWVPLSRKRLKERGYDQARLLAEAAAAELGIPAVPVLEKTVDTTKQSTVGSAEKRKANISGAYRVPDPSFVAGKRILLIDDIVTTGSTLSECARMLLLAGAAEVCCAAAARTRD